MLVCTLLALLQAPVDPVELVDRVAQRYLAMKEFVVEYRENWESPYPFPLNGHRSSRVRAAKSGNRYSYSESSDRNFRIVSDGETVWLHDLSGNQYCEQPAAVAGDELAREGIGNAVLRFGRMNGNAMQAYLMDMEDRRFRGRRIHCAVVRLSSLPADRFVWTELLWIDPVTLFIHRSEFHGLDSPNDGNMGKVVRDFVLPAGAQPPDARLFEFHPPKGARKVDGIPGIHVGGGATRISPQGAGRRP